MEVISSECKNDTAHNGNASVILLHLYKKCQIKSRLFQFLTHGAPHIAFFSKYAADFLIYARAVRQTPSQKKLAGRLGSVYHRYLRKKY